MLNWKDDKYGEKNNILYVVILLLFVLLMGSVGYILFMQNNENNNPDNSSDIGNDIQDDTEKVENNQISTLVVGRNNQIIYNENEIYYTVTYLDYNISESRVYTEKIELDNQEVKEAMIISGALTNDPTEVENYKVSKINEIRFVADTNSEGYLIFGTYCDIVTTYGEHLTFTV